MIISPSSEKNECKYVIPTGAVYVHDFNKNKNKKKKNSMSRDCGD